MSTASIEETEITFPKTVRLQRVPPDVQYADGGYTYVARYRQQGQTVTVRREFSSSHAKVTCDVSDDRRWAKFLPILQRDVRGQIFFK